MSKRLVRLTSINRYKIYIVVNRIKTMHSVLQMVKNLSTRYLKIWNLHRDRDVLMPLLQIPTLALVWVLALQQSCAVKKE